MKFIIPLLTVMLAVSVAATAAQPTVLDQRMKLFRDGALRGFALNELPSNGVSIYTDQDFKDLAATGANVVRVSIQLKRCTGCNVYGRPDTEIAYAKSVLDAGAKYGFRVVVVLLATPWGNSSDYWQNESLKADIVKQWAYVAAQLKSYPALVAYDLINEPVITPSSTPPATAQNLWMTLATNIARTLRRIDPNTPLVVESQPWGLPFPFYDWLNKYTPLPADIKGVVYSFHLYDPHKFTHQGLNGYPLGEPYPSTTSGWDKNGLIWVMDGVKKFSAATKAPVLVGEFSCTRWIGSQCTEYLKDSISIFESNKWSWIYHCFRCYQGWDAEIPSTAPIYGPTAAEYKNLRTSNTPTMQLLRQSMLPNVNTPKITVTRKPR